MTFKALNLSGKKRLPMIRQSEVAECGLAVLAMIAGYYGLEVDIGSLRRRFSVGLQGMTLKSITDIADQLQLSSRPLSVSMDYIGHVQLPAILHWDMNHFVVLKSVAKGKIHIHDPALGECILSEATFSKHFTGIVLELSPTEKFEQRKESTRLRISDLWGRLFGLKRSLIQIFILSSIMQVFVLASPFYLQLAVDKALTSFDTDFLLVLALGFSAFAMINFITQALRGYVLLYFGSMLSFQMVRNLFRHLIRLPVTFFEKRHVGDISFRFSSLEPVKMMLTEGLIASLIDGIMAVSTLIMMLIYSPTLAAIAFGAWFLYLSVRLVFYQPFRSAQENAIISKAKEHSIFIETMRGITSLKLMGGENDREKLWQNKYADVTNTKARSEKLNIWFSSANAGIFGLEHVILIYVAVKMVMAGEFSVGMVFAFMAYKLNFTEKASALIEKTIEFRMLRLHLERISDIAYTEQEDLGTNLLGAVNPKALTGAIEVKDIHYKYSNYAPDVLKGVNLNVKAGEVIAIIGTSGCGKTTLLKIMTGLFSLDKGQVLVDGTPLADYGLAAYRSQISVVMQEDGLFAGSIAENIASFDTQIDMKRVMSVTQAAMVHNEIDSMPMKYESLVGDMGSVLSGGQKQRIMLARALYRQPAILFMDEGTAHLDVITERQVSQSIAKLGITRIMIAHRPETIRMAERIFEMQDGVLVEIEAANLKSSIANSGSKPVSV